MIKQEIESLKQSEVMLDENGNSYEIVSTEKRYEIIPDKNKCFQSKATGHKFIHTNGKQGLPLFVGENELDLYEEVNI